MYNEELRVRVQQYKTRQKNIILDFLSTYTYYSISITIIIIAVLHQDFRYSKLSQEMGIFITYHYNITMNINDNYTYS